MGIDEAIDLIVPVIDKEPTFDFKARFGIILNTADLKFLLRVKNEMEDKGIIERVNPKAGYEYLYRTKGLINDISREGSWTKYKAKLEADKKIIPTVNVKTQKDWKDNLLLWIAVGEFIILSVFTPIGLSIQSNSKQLEKENSLLLDTLSTLNQKNRIYKDSLKYYKLQRDSVSNKN